MRPMILSLLIAAAGPLGAQEIMSYETYNRIRHAEPYLLHLCAPAGNGALLYFGSRHTNDPADEQLQRLEQVFDSFRPDIVLTEGGDLDLDGLDRATAVRRYGEFGLTRWLARGAEVPSEDLDPPREAEIAHLRNELGFSVPRLKVFYTLRQVSQSRRSGAEVDFDQVLPRYLEHLSDNRGLTGRPNSMAEFELAVQELLPELTDWRQPPAQLFYPGPQQPHRFTNDVQTASNDFRDRYHVRRLMGLVDQGDRVFAIVGSTHVVMQEPALRDVLEKCVRSNEP